MIPKRQRFRPIALLCALSAALVLYAGCFSSVTGDEDVSGTVAADGSTGSNANSTPGSDDKGGTTPSEDDSGNNGDTTDDDKGGTTPSEDDSGNNGTAPDDPKNEAGSAACVIGGSRLESFTAADLSKEEFGDTYTIQLVGKWTDDDLQSLGTELQKITGKHITLDMAQVTGIESIGNYAFYKCTSLVAVTIPAGVTSIGNYAFAYCESLASVTIPAGVTSIGGFAFAYCRNLTAVTIPAGVKSIGSMAFQACYSLASVTIPAGVTSIENNTFQACKSLASVTIPAGVKSIGVNAFENCESLASVTISASVTEFDLGVFANCPKLTSVTFEDTSNWYVTTSYNYTGGDLIDVTNAETNATNLKTLASDGGWRDKYLYKKTAQ